MGKAEFLALLPKVYPGSRDFRPVTILSSEYVTDEIKRTWLSQGHEYVYGDNSVNHFKLRVKPKFDEASVDLPPYTGFHYDGSWPEGRWNEYFFYTSSVNYAFGFAVNTYKIDTPERQGEIAPAGSVNGLARPAFKVFTKNGNIYYSTSSSYNYDIHGIRKQVPDNGWEIFPSDMAIDDEAWDWGDEFVLYDGTQQIWTADERLTFIPISVIHWPVIPYYWVEWALNNKPVQPTSDYEALSECFRNTVQNYTGTGMNNIANILEIIDLAKSIYSGDIGSLFESFKDWADNLKISTQQYKLLRDNGVTEYTPKLAEIFKKYGASFVRKVLPDVWLKYRYMYNTTKSDADALVDYVIKEKYSRLRGDEVLRGSIGTSLGTLRLKMRLEQMNDIGLDLKKSLQDAGLFPDLHTLWDLVPFSFVVDWIVPNFESTLEDIDQADWAELYKIHELLVTTDEEWVINYAGFNYTITHYQRELLSSCPQFEIYEDPDQSSKGRTIVKRVIDSASLILSIGG